MTKSKKGFLVAFVMVLVFFSTFIFSACEQFYNMKSNFNGANIDKIIYTDDASKYLNGKEIVTQKTLYDSYGNIFDCFPDTLNVGDYFKVEYYYVKHEDSASEGYTGDVYDIIIEKKENLFGFGADLSCVEMLWYSDNIPQLTSYGGDFTPNIALNNSGIFSLSRGGSGNYYINFNAEDEYKFVCADERCICGTHNNGIPDSASDRYICGCQYANGTYGDDGQEHPYLHRPNVRTSPVKLTDEELYHGPLDNGTEGDICRVCWTFDESGDDENGYTYTPRNIYDGHMVGKRNNGTYAEKYIKYDFTLTGFGTAQGASSAPKFNELVIDYYDFSTQPELIKKLYEDPFISSYAKYYDETDYSYMFADLYCEKITIGENVKGLSGAKNLSHMFDGCRYLKTVEFGNLFENAQPEDISYMFYNCPNLTNINLSTLDTSRVTDMSNMFSGYNGWTIDTEKQINEVMSNYEWGMELLDPPTILNCMLSFKMNGGSAVIIPSYSYIAFFADLAKKGVNIPLTYEDLVLYDSGGKFIDIEPYRQYLNGQGSGYSLESLLEKLDQTLADYNTQNECTLTVLKHDEILERYKYYPTTNTNIDIDISERKLILGGEGSKFVIKEGTNVDNFITPGNFTTIITPNELPSQLTLCYDYLDEEFNTIKTLSSADTNKTLVYKNNLEYYEIKVGKKCTASAAQKMKVAFIGDGEVVDPQYYTLSIFDAESNPVQLSEISQPGKYTVYAEGKDGYYGKTQTKEFTVVDEAISMESFTPHIDALQGEWTGEVHDLDPYLTDNEEIIYYPNEGYSIEIWKKSESGDAITNFENDPLNVGIYEIKFIGDGVSINGSTSLTYTVTPKDISSGVVVTNPNNVEYDGAEHKLKPTLKLGEYTLIENTDYELVWEGDFTNHGLKTITINGKGNFSGSTSTIFTITQRAFNEDNVTVSGIEEKTYNRKAQTQDNIEIIDKTILGKTLELTTDYIVDYSENTNAGENTAIVTITGQGNYLGTITKRFTIKKAAISVVEVIEGVKYDGEEHNQLITAVKAEDLTLEGNEYSVKYSRDGEDPTSDFTSVGTITITVTGDGKNFTGTQTATFTISQENISVIEIKGLTDVTYDGQTHEQTPTIEFKGSELASENYEISYSTEDFVKAQTVTVTVTGKKNFTGSTTATYEIKARDISKGLAVTLEKDAYSYTGSKIEPSVKSAILTYDENQTLTLNEGDYTLEYGDNTEHGNGTVTLHGQGNYTGEYEHTFTIASKLLSEADISVQEISEQEWNGKEIKPNVVVTDAQNGQLTFERDYTVEYSENTNVGEATITITGQGNYGGSKEINFTITQRNLENHVEITGASDTTYTGEPITFDIKVYDAELGRDLKINEEYKIDYQENTNAGKATIVVTAQGENWKGEKQITFTINPKSITKESVSLDHDSFEFDGQNHLPKVTINLDGKELTNDDFKVEYKNATKEHIDEAIELGTYYVVVTGQKNYSGEIEKTFSIGKADLSDAKVTLDWESKIYTGKNIAQNVKVEVGETVLIVEQDYLLEIRLDNANGSKVEEFKNVGTYYVVITGQNNYSGINNEHYFVITPASLQGATVVLSNEDTTWKNAEIKKTIVSVTLSEEQNSIVLSEEEYTLTYLRDGDECQDFTNVGTITLKLTANNENLKDYVDRSYQITARDFAGVKVSDFVDKIYNRQPQEQEISITDDELVYTLEKGKDYNVEYAGSHTDVGDVTVTITPLGNYGGVAKELHFNITAAKITALNLKGNVVYDGNEHRDIIESVMAGDIKLNEGEYEVSYSHSSGVDNDFTSHGTITVTVTGINNFDGTIEKEFKITPSDITELITFEWEDSIWTGEKLVPQIVTSLTTNDYSVEYHLNTKDGEMVSDPSDVGTYVLIVKGQGDYTGSLEKTFTILQRTFEESMLETFQEDYDYTRQAVNLVYSLKYNTYTLREGTDFHVEYVDIESAPIEHGQYSIKFVGDKNLNGEFTKSFTINTLNITEETVTATEEITYNGQDLFNEIIESISIEINSIQLNYETDYTVTKVSEDMKNILSTDDGVKSYTITGKNNFSGSVTLTFIITPKSLDKQTMLNVTSETYKYNYGAGIKPQYTLSFNGTNLKLNVDYQETFENNTDAGNAKMILVGQGNYSGQIEFEYEIGKIDPTVNIVVNETSQVFYAGDNAQNYNANISVGDTDGHITFDSYVFTEEDSEKDEVSLNWTFIPSDNRNFNEYHGQYILTKGVHIKVAIDFNEEQFADLNDLSEVEFELNVTKLIGLESLPLNEELYTILLTNDRGTTVENIHQRGHYTISVDFEDTRFVIVGKSSFQFYVKATTLKADYGVSVYRAEGFEEGVFINIEKITDHISIRETLGENYNELNDIQYIYIITFTKQGQELNIENVYIKQEELEGMKVYFYGNNTLTDVTEEMTNGDIELAQNILVYDNVSINTSNSKWIWITLGSVGGVILLVLVAMIVVYIVKKKKRKY